MKGLAESLVRSGAVRAEDMWDAVAEYGDGPDLRHKLVSARIATETQIAETIADEIKPASTPPDALLCGDGEIGVAIRKALLTRGLAAIRVASPDEYPESRALSITVYRQDFEKLAEQTFNCLLAQNRPGWSASVFPIRGELVEPAAAD